MAFWEMNPEVLGLLWLMASATRGEITFAEDLRDWGKRAVPLSNYTLALALQRGKARKTKSGLK
jgi:hypothetical protein